LLGVSGSIAAIKTVQLIRALEADGAEVRLVVTRHAYPFLASILLKDPWAFALLRRRLVLGIMEWVTAVFPRRGYVQHINLAKWADVALVAPATANTLARIRLGLTDNFLLAVVRAMPRGRPVLLAPAMNTEMWYDPATQETVNALASSEKYTLLPPRTSRLHCGDVGIGAQAQVADIVAAVRSAMSRQGPPSSMGRGD
jgi:phosphopantothenoylcysteine decarboxylase/phosphopantothenate--cysteine ligase